MIVINWTPSLRYASVAYREHRRLGNFIGMASAADLLRIENLDVSFSVFVDRLRVVKQANLRILPGKVTALGGESGSGKSVISQS
ncbi:hypothetical protein, partial [Rhizobium johnstonii]|uniref:hypothetical protein n=1 Tax=Rhizobium johnstonii TaxID=3019933 RepID=UPI003F9B33A2